MPEPYKSRFEVGDEVRIESSEFLTRFAKEWRFHNPLAPEQLFAFRGSQYAFVAILLQDYVPHARPLSDRWDTVTMPAPLFRRAARPLTEFFDAATTPAGNAREPLEPFTEDWQVQAAGLE